MYLSLILYRFHCSDVSLGDFEQVNVDWDGLKLVSFHKVCWKKLQKICLQFAVTTSIVDTYIYARKCFWFVKQVNQKIIFFSLNFCSIVRNTERGIYWEGNRCLLEIENDIMWSSEYNCSYKHVNIIMKFMLKGNHQGFISSGFFQIKGRWMALN